MSSRYILSFELTLPQWVYPHLDRLFNLFKWQVRKTVNSIWNEEYFQKLKEKTSAMSVLKKDIAKPSHIPSRVHRNILELSGQIVRSNIERKQIYDYLMEKPCRVIWSEYKIAEELNTSPL
ncbi:MAG: transposase, partial [Hydrogenobacter thermophilus]|nr:transposase [Hydrogenobacter thermophilus]